MKTNHDKILGKRQQAIKNTFSHIRIPGQSKTFLKFIKSPGHLSNSGVFQDFPGPWLQWANKYKSLPHSSSEPPLEYNQVKPILKNQGKLWPL